MRNYVHFSDSAFIQILLNGFEAFVIKHGNKKRHALEMHASLYGKIEETSTTRHLYVDFISVDTSAEMSGQYVSPKNETQFLKETLAMASGVYLLGTLHSHPYLHHEMTLDSVRERGCKFSGGDESSFHHLLDIGYWEPRSYFLSGLLTIRNKDDEAERQKTTRDGKVGDNIFEFSIANCKCFLNAQIFSLDGNNGLLYEKTYLKCDFLEKFKYVGADYGAVSVAKDTKRILEHK